MGTLVGTEPLRDAAEADDAMDGKGEEWDAAYPDDRDDRRGGRSDGRDDGHGGYSAGGRGGEGRQLCPTCRGIGETPKFLAGLDADGGFSTNRMVHCGTCDGTGGVAGRTR